MKKFLTSVLLIAGTVIGGLLVWRKVEADRTDDLWAEAARASADLDTPRTDPARVQH